MERPSFWKLPKEYRNPGFRTVHFQPQPNVSSMILIINVKFKCMYLKLKLCPNVYDIKKIMTIKLRVQFVVIQSRVNCLVTPRT